MKHTLEVMTVQTSAFRTLIETLKELLVDSNIQFDHTGMKIFTVDTAHIAVIHLKLDADQFEHYYCEKPMTLGINMINFHKVIKTITSNDTLTLFTDSDSEYGNEYLGIKIESAEKKNIYKFTLYDLDLEEVHIDPIEYNSVITLPSTEFQKIIRDMASIANEVEIKNIDKQLFFSCKGDFTSLEISLSSEKGNLVINNRNIDKITQGVFNLKYLFMFTKCTNLSSTVEIHLRNDLPLIVEYGIASLGRIKLGMSPTIPKDKDE